MLTDLAEDSADETAYRGAYKKLNHIVTYLPTWVAPFAPRWLYYITLPLYMQAIIATFPQLDSKRAPHGAMPHGAIGLAKNLILQL